MVCPLHMHMATSNVISASGRERLLPAARSQQRRGDACVAYVLDNASSPGTPTNARPSSVKPSGTTGTISVKVTQPRPPSTPPSPPSLIHSPVYVQKALSRHPDETTSSGPSPPRDGLRLVEADEEQEGQQGNGLVWALKQVDRSLDELEQRPLPLQRELYELSCGPVGTATSAALGAAAKATVAATKEAVRAALPVGQWLAREGARAALALVSAAAAEAATRQQQQQRQGSKAPQQQRGSQGAGNFEVGGTTKVRVNKGS